MCNMNPNCHMNLTCGLQSSTPADMREEEEREQEGDQEEWVGEEERE